MRLEVILGDICRVPADVIVNAANERLEPGVGVDGAIRKAAGARLGAACRGLPEVSSGVRCPVGECRITPGFDLSASHVIHTVGPVWVNGRRGEEPLLRRCYRSVLDAAAELGACSIAFPAIACGAHGFPLDLAARIAVSEISAGLERHGGIQQAILVAFDAHTHAALVAAA